LRVKARKIKKKLKNSIVLDIAGFGYNGETSCNAYVDSSKRLEDTCSKLPKRKNEEKAKNYVKVLKGRDYGQQESKRNEYKRDTFLGRSSTFRQQEVSIMVKKTRREDRDKPRHEFRRTTSQRRSFTPKYESFFYGYFFTCANFGHKVVDRKAYGRNVQARNSYVAPRNIECYKFHNYGHIAQICRSMIEPSMKENVDIRYKNF